MDFIALLRDLAKSEKYQTLFSHFKESNGTIFENRSDFTTYQIVFMNFLYFYHNIYTDIALEEVDEIVITDHIYEDAWARYKRKQRLSDFKEMSAPYTKPQKQEKFEKGNQQSFSWVFKKPKK